MPELNVRSGIVTVTPQLAVKWLEHNTHNRDVDRRRVLQYARDMRGGTWVLNGEAVKFSASKALLDGQHRLLAVIEADRPVDLLVVTGLAENAQETMDQGLPRSFGDTLKLRGETDYLHLAATTRVVCCFELYGVPYVPSGSPQPSIQQQSRTLDRNGEIRDSVKATLQRRRPWLPLSQAAALHYLMAQVDPPAASTFFEQLADGIGLTGTEPVYVLRERLIADQENDHAEGMRLRAQVKLAFIIRAWNATRAGETIQRLLWDPSGRFPAIDGLADSRDAQAAA